MSSVRMTKPGQPSSCHHHLSGASPGLPPFGGLLTCCMGREEYRLERLVWHGLFPPVLHKLESPTKSPNKDEWLTKCSPSSFDRNPNPHRTFIAAPGAIDPISWG